MAESYAVDLSYMRPGVRSLAPFQMCETAVGAHCCTWAGKSWWLWHVETSWIIFLP